MNKLEQEVGSPRGWKSGDAGDGNDWVISLPEDLIRDFADREENELDASVDLLQQWNGFFEDALKELNEGRGFVLLERVPIESFSEEQCRRVYWRIGQSLGQPIEQNIEGMLLYDVRDTGQSVGEGARFSVTNAESSFHTDAAFAENPPEFVGLLSLHSAVSGGESQLVSAYTLHSSLANEAADLMDTLYEDFSFDRRGQFHPGEPELMVAPVFRWDGNELDTRYLHYYITEGHRSGESLTDRQTNSLDKLLEIVSRPEMRVTFSLKPGQMLFTNNHWILHNRTAFEDHVDPGKGRHYIRLWLNRREPQMDTNKHE
jgi:alpha-ketoglutarate-dependent taurine dioxygenase